jgi:hypothetical protein
VRQAGEPPYEAEDFMFAGARAARKAEAARDHMEIMRENQRLNMMRPGDTEGVPGWALPPKEQVN